MNNKKDIFFQFDGYAQLTNINGINFTRREIDIIACLVNARGTSKIASFLFISPKTVVNHIRNIMIKLECNSREGIIDFIERSNKAHGFRAHYSNLLVSTAFEKSLKEISKIKKEESLSVKIIYHESDIFQKQLANLMEVHLRLAGLTVSIKVKEQEKNTPLAFSDHNTKEYTIYMSATFEEKELQINSSKKNSDLEHKYGVENTLFIFFEEAPLTKILKKFPGLPYINLEKAQNYYYLLFEILQKLLPNINIQNIITEFKKHFKYSKENIDSKIVNIEPDIKNTDKKETPLPQAKRYYQLSRKTYFLTITIICIGFLSVKHLFFNTQKSENLKKDNYKNNLKENSQFIRSDLVLPTESVLLNRPELLAHINDKFIEKKGIHVVALVGSGGTGKTTLARQYAQRQESNVVWELNAETNETLKSSFEALAEALAKTEEDKDELKNINEINSPTKKEDKLIQFVKDHLRLHSNWFLIYDNVEKILDIQKYFPQDLKTWGEGRIILTTRDENVQNNKNVGSIIQIGDLNSDQKFALFHKIMTSGREALFTPEQNKEVKKFLEEIPSFPLDVSIAAYYIKSTNVPYKIYLEYLYKNNKDFIYIQKNILKATGDYTQVRYNIIALSLQHLINENKDFAELLLFISILDSQNIPRELLTIYKDNAVVDNFIYNLKKYSIITNHFTSDSIPVFSIHRSTQAVSLSYLKKKLNLEKNNMLIQTINDVLRHYMISILEKKDLSKIKLLISHCEMVLSHNNLLNIINGESLKIELADFYYHLSYYVKAKQILEEYFLTLRNGNKKNHTKIAHALTSLGSVYRELGNFKKARKLLEESLATYKNHLPADHMNIAQTLAHLGNVYRGLGDYEKAKNLLEESLRIHKKYFSKYHGNVIAILTQLSIINRELGNYKASKDLLVESLIICRKYFPNNQLGIARALLHLGNVHGNLGNYEKAKDLLEESLRIHKNLMASDNIDLAQALVYLGHAYENLANYTKACSIFKSSLEVQKKHFKEDHYKVARTLLHLGSVYGKIGNYKEAKNLLKQSHISFKKHFGENHNETARVLTDLGQIYLLENKTEAAEKITKTALTIFQRNHHPESYICLEQLAEIYLKNSVAAKKNGRISQSHALKSQATSFLNQALQVIKLYFPQNSPHTKKIQNKLKNIN